MRNLCSSRKPDLVFWHTGRIDITSHVARRLRLTAGDVVNIMTDGEEYYLYVQYRAPLQGRYEGAVFPSNRNGNHFRTCSKRICIRILEECRAVDRARLCVGTPVESEYYGILLPIITKHLL